MTLAYQVPEPLYFGCITHAGHHLWRGSRSAPRGLESGLNYGLSRGIDAAYCPGSSSYVDRQGHRRTRQPDTQPEGHAALHHEQGLTLLAFWDRSVDSRKGSNSVFILPGTLSFEDAVSAARAAYPHVFERQRAEVRLVQPPEARARAEAPCSS